MKAKPSKLYSVSNKFIYIYVYLHQADENDFLKTRERFL